VLCHKCWGCGPAELVCSLVRCLSVSMWVSLWDKIIIKLFASSWYIFLTYLLYCYNLLTDVSSLNGDGVHNRHSSRVWSDDNPHAAVESNFALRFIANVWCAVLDDQVIGPFTFEGRLTWEVYVWFLKEELLQLSDDVPVNITRSYVLPAWLRLVFFRLKLEFP